MHVCCPIVLFLFVHAVTSDWSTYVAKSVGEFDSHMSYTDLVANAMKLG